MSKMIDVEDEPNATLPANDVERWIAGTYAIWSEYSGGSCKYLGGYEKTAENAKMAAKLLKRDWLVNNRKSGVEMIEYLLKHAGPENGDDDGSDFGDEEYSEDFEDDEEYDGEEDEDFEDDEEYDGEDDEDFEDDEEYDGEDDEDFEDDEYDGEDDEDIEDDEEYGEDDEDEVGMNFKADTTAFDYACACNMCGRMFIAGYFTREESIFYATKAAKKIQEKYNSWVEYFQAYIFGAAAGSNAKQVEPFIEAFQKIMGMSMQENPIYMDWNIDLN